MKMAVYVDGKELPQDSIDDWELRRSRIVARFLKSEFGVTLPPGIADENGASSIASIRAALTQAKLGLESAQVRRSLGSRIAFSTLLVKVLGILSFRHRKAAVVEIVCEGAAAKDIVERVGDLFLTNSPRNRELNMLGSPDHYVLEAHDDRIQEIIETTGGAPAQSQVFVNYDDESEVHFPKDPAFPLQMAGVARLKDGTSVGGIRHQYRDEGNGFRAKIADEFPALFPRCLVRAHQLHLACEFGIWYRTLLEEPEGVS
jgi:hypothetical protein